MRDPLGWSYPAGAEHDPNAPYNQTDEGVCSKCEGANCLEDSDKCAVCAREEEIEKEGKTVVSASGAKPCPLCGDPAIVWIDPKLSTLTPPTDFYSIGCIDVGGCGVEMTGWLRKEQMIAHWNKRNHAKS